MAATFTVTTTVDGGAGSLRQAIIDANAPPNGAVPDRIEFSIPDPLSLEGAHTIQPLSELPAVSDPAIIDATTEPDFTGTPVVELDGSLAGPASGFTITAGNSTVRGLVINRFAPTGITLLGAAGGNTIEGNYIGTDVSGTADRGNSNAGVDVIGASNNTIGGTTSAARNVISGNNVLGVWIRSGTFVGPGTGNQVLGNFIGTDVNGTASLGNAGDGIQIVSEGNTVGGTASGSGNLISGNGANGIMMVSGGGIAGNNNVVEGNLIGTDVGGTAALENTSDGVEINATTGNRIGGGAAAARNVLSGNRASGVGIFNSAASDNRVQGNFIGTDDTGMSRVANRSNGVTIAFDAHDNLIGGDGGEGNYISGNFGDGVQIIAGPVRNRIDGNGIGINTADANLGNFGHGVRIQDSSDNIAGSRGPSGGSGNTIAFNSSAGVAVVSSGTGNSANGNGTFSNGGLGFDIGANGVTANDTDDVDVGPNGLQNFPVLTAATSAGGTTTIAGSLNSAASRTYRLDFFSDPTCDGSGFGEGQFFLHTANVTTDSSGSAGGGNATFNVSVSQSVSPGHVVTATATDLTTNNTSEFSACQSVTAGDTPTFVVNSTDDTDDGSCTVSNCTLREAINRSNAVAGPDTISFGISGSGVHTITPGSELPTVTDPATIDGTTQSGFNPLDPTPVIELDGSQTSQADGVRIFAGSSTVRGLAVNRFDLAGIGLFGVGGNVIQGNFLGTDPSGTVDEGNSRGIDVYSANNQIGGTGSGEGNVASGNTSYGIQMGADNNQVEGNLVGTDASGMNPLGNDINGVFVNRSKLNLIGGTTADARNVIAGNGFAGVNVNGDNVDVTQGSQNDIQGNYIGTDATGTGSLGNVIGVVLHFAHDNLVGGPAAGEGNVIAFNASDGIHATSSPSEGNRLLSNAIFGNGGLGINLVGNDPPSGVTTNDSGDVDVGPNELQNFPELTSASPDSSTTVRGTLDTEPGTYRLEFFSNTTCDGSGFGEGATFEGSQDLVAGSGPTPFTVVLSNTLPLGSFVTATATDANGNTSELSQCIQVAEANAADLRITKSDSPDPVTAGMDLAYSLTVTNDGPSEAPNVTLTDNLPAGLSGAQYCTGSGCTPDTAWTGSLDLGAVASGSAVEIRIRATVGAGVTAPSLSNEASVSGLVTDPNEANNTVNENTTVVTSADLRITNQDDHETTPVLAGDPLTYTISVTNDGASNAQNVQLDDALPSELTEAKYCQGTNCGGFSSNWTGALDLDTVAVGQTKVVRIQAKVRSNTDAGTVIHNVASLTSDTADPDAGDNADAEDTAVETDANLDIFKLAVGQRRNNSPSNPNTYNPPVVAGDYLIYGLRINNYGPSDARDVVVTDNLPTQLEEENATYCFDQGCQDWSTPWTGTLNLGTLVPGDSVVVRIRAKVPPNVVNNTIINNQGSVTSSTPDSNQTLNNFNLNTRIITRADLDVTKTATPSPNVVAGERITYTLTLLNDGPSDAQNVVLNDTLPASQFDDARFCVGQSCVVNGFSPAWTGSTPFGTVPTGEARYVTINARVLPSVLEGTNLHNTAAPGSSTIDPIPANNAGESDTNVHARADLSISKDDQPDPVIAGEDLAYTLTVTNAGPSDAQNVVFEDNLPDELDDTEARYCVGATCTVDENSPLWVFDLDVGTIAAGGTEVVKIKAPVKPEIEDRRIGNLAIVRSDTIDPNITDPNYDQEDTDIITRADLVVAKGDVVRTNPSDEAEPVIAGTRDLTYDITVTNGGSSYARNVVVTDNLPSSLEDAHYCVDTVGGPACSPDATNAPWQGSHDFGTIPNGSSRTVRISVKVKAAVLEGSVIHNDGSATSSTVDPDAGDNTEGEDTDVIARADLSIVQTEFPEPVNAGDPITFPIKVTNGGPSDAQSVTVDDVLPPELVRNDPRYADPRYCLGENCDTFNLTWNGSLNLGVVTPGEQKFVTIRATVNPSLDPGTDVIVNTATVDSPTTDPDPDTIDKSSTTRSDVSTLANLDVFKLTVGWDGTSPNTYKEPVVAGEYAIFGLQVNNHGPSDSRNVVLSDDLNRGILPTVLDIANAKYCFGEGCFNFGPAWTGSVPLGTMGPGDRTAVRILVPVRPNAPHGTRFCNIGEVSASTPDTNTALNRATVCLGITTKADLGITKSSPQDLVQVNGLVTYNLNVANNGPSDAQSVSVTDPIPGKLANPRYCVGGGCTPGPAWTGSLNLGTIPRGESRLIRIDTTPSQPAGDVLARFGPQVTYGAATVGSTTLDPVSSNDSGPTSATTKICSLLGTEGGETLTGGNGDDLLCGRGGNDTLRGGSGHDVLEGDYGDPRQTIPGGIDALQGGPGDDVIDGDGGVDTATYQDVDVARGGNVAGVTLSLDDSIEADALGSDTVMRERTDTGPIAGDSTIENVTGSQYNDELTGDETNNALNAGPTTGACTNPSCTGVENSYYRVHTNGRDQGGDVLRGRGGDDALTGREGNDALRGGPGSDNLQGGDGFDLLAGQGHAASDDDVVTETAADTLNGGNGFDIAWYLGAWRTVTVNLGTDSASGEGPDSLPEIENVKGSNFRDILVGGGDKNSIDGSGGNDSIDGAGGDDSSVGIRDPRNANTQFPGLTGGAGNEGGGAQPTNPILGGAGDDFLVGGAGSDSLNGQGGPDTCVRGNPPDPVSNCTTII